MQSDMCPTSGQCLYSWGERTKKLPAPLERSELFCLHRYLKTPQAALGSQESRNTSGRDVTPTPVKDKYHFQVAFSL